MQIWTYRKHSASSGPEWIAYIYAPEVSKHRLPVAFEGRTEDEAAESARAEWEKREDQRAQTIANRKEAAEKRAKRAAEKRGEAS